MCELTQLPEDPVLNIVRYLNNADLSNLSKTCRTLSIFTQPERSKRALSLLLASVIDDKREMVHRILASHPALLLKTPHYLPFIESQYTWQKFFAESPLKIALIRNQVEMIKVMLPYLQRLDLGDVMQQWEQAEEEIKLQKTTYNFDTLIAAINTSGQDMEDALQAFRDAVLPKDTIALNNYYNIEALLRAAHKAYHNKFNNFTDWDQRDIFSVKVIGFLQSLVTPEVAQLFCEGLYDVVREGRPIRGRAASLKLLNGVDFYRASCDSVEGLGYQYLCSGAAASHFTNGRGGDAMRGIGVWVARLTGAGVAASLKNYLEQKHQSLQNLKTSLYRLKFFYPNNV